MLEIRMKAITSRQNPTVRVFRELADTPDSAGTRILLDGVHLVRDAHAAGATFEAVAVDASRLTSRTEEAELARALEHDGVEVLSASTSAIAAMSPVTSPSGIVAIARRQAVAVEELFARPRAFLLAAVDVQDPGNLGSLVRAAEAGGVSGVIVCGMSANPFSWKSLRGSMGSALRLPIASGSRVDEVMTQAKASGARTIASVARDGRSPDEIDWSGSVVLLLGGEGPGLGESVAAACDERVTIPMTPAVESLNVAVAAGILVYAARRHR
jgi:RNA methyltransferase, TrmH family